MDCSEKENKEDLELGREFKINNDSIFKFVDLMNIMVESISDSHVAGIIAASNYNNEVMGVAPDCKLLIAKALNKDGTGTYQSI
ncbi:S8 family serine peptidase, partial [Clostridioides difficile]|uniref:S8 family serine peptidase n=1 Tax=Clostridioides difficile TaxID=1496 RepID=UPI003F8D0C7E